nr:MAG: replication initiator protein [Microvirus sp.]
MCLSPINAEIDSFSGRVKFTVEGSLRLPCGKCTECISKRALEWGTRAKHEISTHDENCFITLTYDEQNLPSILIVKSEFQKFMKRLRKKVKKPLRYMVSHEYGTRNFRPHHHAIIFGYSPSDLIYLRTTPSGEKIFTSKELSELWKHGYHSIGTANERTAYYIASYSLKGNKHELSDPISGEVICVSDSMDCSKRPAIGYNYFEKNYEQLLNTGQILPRFYFKKLATLNPQLHERYENDRMLKLKTRSSHELYAKFIIDSQKIHDNEFRETENIKNDEALHLKTKLKTERDDYHRNIKTRSEK